MSDAYEIPWDELADFLVRWEVERLEFLDQVPWARLGARGSLHALVHAYEEREHTLVDMVRMERELEGILGRKVNLINGSSGVAPQACPFAGKVLAWILNESSTPRAM